MAATAVIVAHFSAGSAPTHSQLTGEPRADFKLGGVIRRGSHQPLADEDEYEADDPLGSTQTPAPTAAARGGARRGASWRARARQLAAILVGVMAYGAHATRPSTADDADTSSDSVVTSPDTTARRSFTSDPRQAPEIFTPDTTPVTRSHGS